MKHNTGFSVFPVFAASMAVLTAGSVTCPAAAGEEAVVTTRMISPIIDMEGADPFVTQYEDGYLYTKTSGSDIRLAYADSVSTIGLAEMKTVYDPGTRLQDLWAPEIWNLDGVWYIYFAATVPGEEMHFMYVLSNPEENPLEGEWTMEPVAGMDDKFAIDGSIMDLNGKRYFIWSGWEGYENVRQDLYLAEMISPTEVMNEKIMLSMPEYDFELNGTPLINEGPSVIVNENTVNLVYSASGSWTDDYCLGLLTLDIDEDPKIPENWEKETSPVLEKDYDLYGPGHNCFIRTTDGSQDLIIYHAARWMRGGWSRSVRYGYADFDENGKLQHMTGVCGDEEIELPEEEEAVTVISADDFVVSEDIKIRGDQGKRYAEGFLAREDTASFTIYSDMETDACILVMVRGQALLEGLLSGIEISVNETSISYPVYASEDYAPAGGLLHLMEGENTVTIRTDTGGSTLEILRAEIR